LFAANLLLRAGWDVEVFERVGEVLAERGAGIVTHDELFDALKRAGATIDATIGCETLSRVTLDRDGRVIAELPLRQILTAWGRIYRLLKDVFPAGHYHFDKSLERIEQDDQAAVARFSDGTSAAGDLLIGADGIRSTVRAQFLPEVKPAYAGYVAWRGLADESSLSAAARRVLSDRMGFGLPPGEQMLTYLVAGRNNTTRLGERRYNFVWYRPADEKTGLPALFTDAAGHRYQQNIPPDRIKPEVIADMHAAAERLLAPQFVEVVRATADPFFQPIYDLESPRLVFGRVAILGDAAFVARPHVGLGVTKAAGDAAALADALAQHESDLNLALHQYEASRVNFGKSIVAHARDLGAGIGNARATGDRPGLVEHMRRPEVIMREIAVPDWAERTVVRGGLRVA
jgi:2-polyprenyl-6-methoxyphenol hydroxylase-like FAD-dependent oxidoreductase